MCLILLSLIVTGCSRVEYIEHNNTIYVDRNNTIYNTIEVIKNNTIVMPCNDTPDTNQSYLLSLIRRIKFLEKQQTINYNISECLFELNRSKEKLDKAKSELCLKWNVSWC